VHYPSKILLFGEHSVLRGSQALAIPYQQFSGHWAYSDDLSKQMDLSKWGDYLKKLVKNGEIALDTEGVQNALKKGLFFESNIPRGYGAGSSGALVAGLYDVFGLNKDLTINELKIVLGKIESFFHGSSSGLDPLVSYLQKTILIKKDKSIALLDDVKTDAKMFLLDTHQSRKTEPLVHLFLDKCTQSAHYQATIDNELVPYVDDAIAAFLQNNTKLLFDTVHQISYCQYRFFTEMIPLSFKNVWLEGLASDVYKLKLCGAGGGGFILGFCSNYNDAKKALSKMGFNVLPITGV
jgi:mevalonate kinase